MMPNKIITRARDEVKRRNAGNAPEKGRGTASGACFCYTFYFNNIIFLFSASAAYF
jgi:hypothetical protein